MILIFPTLQTLLGARSATPEIPLVKSPAIWGRANAVHVSLGENNEPILNTVVAGDTVREVLDYVQFNSRALIDQFRTDVEISLRENRIGYEEAGKLLRFYEDGMNGYTYLER